MIEIKRDYVTPEEEINFKNNEIKVLKEEIKMLEKYKVYQEGADETRAMFDAYVNSGFTEDQAMKLITVVIGGAMAANAADNIFN